MHTEELIRDLGELHFIETEYQDDVYFLTERGYTFLEQQGLDDSKVEPESVKKKSRVVELIVVGLGVLALLYAANLYVNMKTDSEEVLPTQEIKRD